ncbi:MAG TPA: hypothetical protein VG713_19660 [Pirellulales bacterium]|nr:hypothetical protein [Pirellulales bacterium]
MSHSDAPKLPQQPAVIAQCIEPQLAAQAEVARRVEQALRSSPYLALRTITCEFDGESLFLRGRVPTFHTKQVAFTVVERLALDVELVDQLEVAAPTPVRKRRRLH